MLSGVHADQVNIEGQILGSPVIICKSYSDSRFGGF